MEDISDVIPTNAIRTSYNKVKRCVDRGAQNHDTKHNKKNKKQK